ncbi:ChaB family protein [Dyella agri]|uniref:ChaB family protein n=1 Tax=Dyella agri TaxID=1926869 RepID=A0ABW8KJ07_9GAMM
MISVITFNHAWEEYADEHKQRGGESREETVRKVAWSAVKQGCAKGDDAK